MDVPQAQLKARIIPPDPVPVMNARPENFLMDDIDYQTTQDGDILVANIAITEPIYLTDSGGTILTDADGVPLVVGESVTDTEIKPTVAQNVANNREPAE